MGFSTHSSFCFVFPVDSFFFGVFFNAVLPPGFFAVPTFFLSFFYSSDEAFSIVRWAIVLVIG